MYTIIWRGNIIKTLRLNVLIRTFFLSLLDIISFALQLIFIKGCQPMNIC